MICSFSVRLQPLSDAVAHGARRLRRRPAWMPQNSNLVSEVIRQIPARQCSIRKANPQSRRRRYGRARRRARQRVRHSDPSFRLSKLGAPRFQTCQPTHSMRSQDDENLVVKIQPRPSSTRERPPTPGFGPPQHEVLGHESTDLTVLVGLPHHARAAAMWRDLKVLVSSARKHQACRCKLHGAT